jgi:aerobic-type carbon monoxide dehydrogenase small subunit (CoxS/CutS family)
MSIGQHSETAQEQIAITLTVNGATINELVPARMSLANLLRDRLALNGTHIACDQGVCGACTVLIDGRSARSCLIFAVQADGREVTTVEGLSQNGALSELQHAFIRHQALQCGFCTPGFLMLATELVDESRSGPLPSRDEIRERLAANICRCTGYHPLIDAVEEVLRGASQGGDHDRP